MDNNLVSLIVGIVSSLIATAVFIGLSMLYRKVLVPWIEDKIYKGVRVDGIWHIDSLSDKDVSTALEKVVLEIDQNGENVFGMCHLTDNNGKNKLIRFLVK